MATAKTANANDPDIVLTLSGAEARALYVLTYKVDGSGLLDNIYASLCDVVSLGGGRAHYEFTVLDTDDPSNVVDGFDESVRVKWEG